ncbi:MAG: hypothetical protein JNM37_11175 [Rhodocyclaceae bacterium]|nr:hypothetical protein [Rhodocyclaceae bacterium]HMZ84154.1 hypothetical protein [Rhodocyclaceae bacterium]
MRHARAAVVLAWFAFVLNDTFAAGARDGAKPQVHDASQDDVLAFVRRRGMTVLTFAGYSASGYEDEAAMRAQAAAVLDRHDPRITLVNIGATAEGIGAVYALARARGFETLGIVSSRARDEGVALSPAVDHVFFVRDAGWGGIDAATGRLSPASATVVAASDEIVAIGGGDSARDEMLAARAAGKPVTFIAADMDHHVAREKAAAQGALPPTDFRGSAHAAFATPD